MGTIYIGKKMHLSFEFDEIDKQYGCQIADNYIEHHIMPLTV